MTTEWKKCSACGHDHPVTRCDSTGVILDQDNKASVDMTLWAGPGMERVNVTLHYKDCGLMLSELPNRVVQVIKQRALEGDTVCQRIIDSAR